ncbi:MAG: hypothetical protein FJ042_03920 [Candidatus Cloacimonetes bacterium]|nr:hypothetical protein [Candidatus Cloacimonadota bacterium]
MSRYTRIDLSRARRYSLEDRASKVNTGQFAKPGKVSLNTFWDCCPDLLQAKRMKELISACRIAKEKGKAIIIGLGGHVIKLGLAPLLVEMMEAGYVTCFCANGSVAIHDYEIGRSGCTSEDVSRALADGSFGMAAETADGINAVLVSAAEEGLGAGEALGMDLWEHAPHRKLSLMANAWRLGIPVTVHIAIGTDIIHQHPSANGAALGKTSLDDFFILTEQMTGLNDGGVFINFGSAVVIPEVLVKALNLARNTGHEVRDFTTAVFDMNSHYRPWENIVRRPVETGGKGYYFIGHHELMIPLFVKSLLY